MRKWSLLSITDLHYELEDANYADDPKDLSIPGLRNEVFQDFNAILDYGFSKEEFDLVANWGRCYNARPAHRAHSLPE